MNRRGLTGGGLFSQIRSSPYEWDVADSHEAGYDQYRLFQIIGGFPVFLEIADPSPIFMVLNNVVGHLCDRRN
ncbi:MAG: hypothetical protein R2787_04555 [Saprospiraceae bacterium]